MAHENVVSLKLPTFWTSHPHVWFAQTEAQFHLRSITNEDTMYFHVLAALDQSTATRLLGLINKPPATGKYTAIKKGYWKRLASANKLEQPDYWPLGDSKPSVLMDEMLALLGDHTPRVSSSISSSSSVDIRIQLADCDLDDCRLPARKADALWSHNYITTGRLSLTASVAGLKDSLFYVYDKFTNCHFLVDTGAEVSVLPASALDTHAAQQ